LGLEVGGDGGSQGTHGDRGGERRGHGHIGQVLEGHVTLDLECLDRIYLNAYVPRLQVSGQVVTFLTQHLGNPIPSPALFNQIGERFRAAVARFAAGNHIPVVHFDKAARKAEVMRPYLDAARAAGRPGVVAVGVAQEFQRVFCGSGRKPGGHRAPQFSFVKADRRVSCCYFYVWDSEFGPGFIKVCSYFPSPAKVWVNGHEWAKQQAIKQGLGFTELANGFASTEDPQRLQQVCDRLGPADLQGFFDRWLQVIPTPLDDQDRAAGYWWELSMRQVEVSRTLVLDTHGARGRSSRRWWPTTSVSAGPTRSRSSLIGASAPIPTAGSPPGSSPAAWRSPSTSSTSTHGSSNT
jgi:hypothetical protein